jgi:crossover junction endodeoxyribonuclease RuvC
VVIALGVDPGTRQLGWGVVVRRGSTLEHVAHGVIRLDPRETLAVRLHRIEQELSLVLGQHRPDVGSVETLFFHKDAQAAAKLGHARGVVLMSLARAGVEVAEYAPARVKRAIVGHGRADKRQVALMIRTLLRLSDTPASDAADALALAVTHLRLGALAPLLAKGAGPLDNPILAAMARGRRRRFGARRGLHL